MSEPARKQTAPLYDLDFHAWSEEQGRLLKERSAASLDWDNLAEEIESLGRSERSEIRNRLIVILQHLLKWQFQPAQRKAGWSASIFEARSQLSTVLDESPSLRSYPTTVIDKPYQIARRKAAAETGLPLEAFPTKCPYSLEQVMDLEFLPGSQAG